ncbi:MAG: transcriptional regulator [Mycobacterium sp.]|nr:transcriptional regulator [Mycobacterium sp.]
MSIRSLVAICRAFGGTHNRRTQTPDNYGDAMASVVTRQSYFDAGLDVLAELGYGGLKLAEVCNRLGVTTGSFYHYFTSWSAYTRALIAHWQQVRTISVIDVIRAEPDPRQRIGSLIKEGLALPHGAEGAIRVWSAIDAEVHAVQSAVDRQRFDCLVESAFEILKSARQAQVFASWALYLLVGYEQALLPPRSADDIEWIADQLLNALDTGRFGSLTDNG